MIFDRTPVILLGWDGKILQRDNTPFYTHTPLQRSIRMDRSTCVEFYVASRDRRQAAKRAGNKYQMLRDQILSFYRLVSADK